MSSIDTVHTPWKKAEGPATEVPPEWSKEGEREEGERGRERRGSGGDTPRGGHPPPSPPAACHGGSEGATGSSSLETVSCLYNVLLTFSCYRNTYVYCPY